MSKLLNANESLYIVIDLQEKLVKILEEDSKVIKNSQIIAKTSSILNIPIVITEQYKKGLGETIPEITSSVKKENVVFFEKNSFSALKEDGFLELLKKSGKKQIMISGIESHICVMQTALELSENGYQVFVIKDASASRDNNQLKLAMDRLNKNENIDVITTEMAVFELLKTSKNDHFKEIQALIK